MTKLMSKHAMLYVKSMHGHITNTGITLMHL